MMPMPHDQRREVRRAGSGKVQIRWNSPRPTDVVGRLVDVSDSGFRMAHNCASLMSGQVVEFNHVEAKGQAKVVWTRIVGQEVETGFVVVGAR